jgi:hypothetical protein
LILFLEAGQTLAQFWYLLHADFFKRPLHIKQASRKREIQTSTTLQNDWRSLSVSGE